MLNFELYKKKEVKKEGIEIDESQGDESVNEAENGNKTTNLFIFGDGGASSDNSSVEKKSLSEEKKDGKVFNLPDLTLFDKRGEEKKPGSFNLVQTPVSPEKENEPKPKIVKKNKVLGMGEFVFKNEGDEGFPIGEQPAKKKLKVEEKAEEMEEVEEKKQENEKIFELTEEKEEDQPFPFAKDPGSKNDGFTFDAVENEKKDTTEESSSGVFFKFGTTSNVVKLSKSDDDDSTGFSFTGRSTVDLSDDFEQLALTEAAEAKKLEEESEEFAHRGFTFISEEEKEKNDNLLMDLSQPIKVSIPLTSTVLSTLNAGVLESMSISDLEEELGKQDDIVAKFTNDMERSLRSVEEEINQRKIKFAELVKRNRELVSEKLAVVNEMLEKKKGNENYDFTPQELTTQPELQVLLIRCVDVFEVIFSYLGTYDLFQNVSLTCWMFYVLVLNRVPVTISVPEDFFANYFTRFSFKDMTFSKLNVRKVCVKASKFKQYNRSFGGGYNNNNQEFTVKESLIQRVEAIIRRHCRSLEEICCDNEMMDFNQVQLRLQQPMHQPYQQQGGLGGGGFAFGAGGGITNNNNNMNNNNKLPLGQQWFNECKTLKIIALCRNVHTLRIPTSALPEKVASMPALRTLEFDFARTLLENKLEVVTSLLKTSTSLKRLYVRWDNQVILQMSRRNRGGWHGGHQNQGNDLEYLRKQESWMKLFTSLRLVSSPLRKFVFPVTERFHFSKDIFDKFPASIRKLCVVIHPNSRNRSQHGVNQYGAGAESGFIFEKGYFSEFLQYLRGRKQKYLVKFKFLDGVQTSEVSDLLAIENLALCIRGFNREFVDGLSTATGIVKLKACPYNSNDFLFYQFVRRSVESSSVQRLVISTRHMAFNSNLEFEERGIIEKVLTYLSFGGNILEFSFEYFNKLTFDPLILDQLMMAIERNTNLKSLKFIKNKMPKHKHGGKMARSRQHGYGINQWGVGTGKRRVFSTEQNNNFVFKDEEMEQRRKMAIFEKKKQFLKVLKENKTLKELVMFGNRWEKEIAENLG